MKINRGYQIGYPIGYPSGYPHVGKPFQLSAYVCNGIIKCGYPYGYSWISMDIHNYNYPLTYVMG